MEEETTFRCDFCRKPATKNIKNMWHIYSIDEKGEKKEEKVLQGGDDCFYCDKCYNKYITGDITL